MKSTFIRAVFETTSRLDKVKNNCFEAVNRSWSGKTFHERRLHKTIKMFKLYEMPCLNFAKVNTFQYEIISKERQQKYPKWSIFRSIKKVYKLLLKKFGCFPAVTCEVFLKTVKNSLFQKLFFWVIVRVSGWFLYFP